MNYRPMLAEDWDSAKQRYPVIVMPKIDGVRAMNLDGKLYGRSLKQFANKFITETFSIEDFNWLDGEMAAASSTHPRLVNLTSSALSTEMGEPYIIWWLFDCTDPEVKDRPYIKRLEFLETVYRQLEAEDHPLFYHLQLVEWRLVNNEKELLAAEQEWLDEGYEGVIIRDPNGLHKEGRSTIKEGGFLRIKRFALEEAFVYGFEEAQANNNVAETNELGYTKRSSHKANKVGKGQIGNLLCVDLKTGQLITVGPGKMSHDSRRGMYNHPDLIVHRVIKYKHFPKGVKEKPRFPTFEVTREPADLDPVLGRIAQQLKIAFGG